MRTGKNHPDLHTLYYRSIKGGKLMSKPEITVTCVFPDKGETACQILYRSFRFFLERELTGDSRKPAIPATPHGG